MMHNLVYKDEVYQIVGAALEVYNNLGPGFLEAVYQEAMQIELTRQNIPHVEQKLLDIYFKGHILNKKYQADFICFDKIILELKANDKLNSTDEAQLLNYLKAVSLKLGLLINFGNKHKLEWKRIIR